MFKLVVVISANPDKAQEFEELVKPLIAASRKEPGNISYDFYPDAVNENVYLFLETWASDEALEEHNATRHFVDFAAKVNEYTSGPMEIHRINL